MDNILSKDSRTFWMGISILYVILYHLVFFSNGQIEYPHWIRIFFVGIVKNGFLGVDVFLFLSAYGLCHSFSKNSLKVFYTNRIKRLLSTYILFAIIVTAFFLTEETTINILRDWTFQITGLAVIKPIANPNHIEWYTPSLILLYIFFPLLFSLVKKLSDNPLLLYTTLFLLVIGANFISYFISDNLSNRLPIIITGVLTYLFLPNNNKLVLVYSFLGILSFIAPNYTLGYCLCVPIVLYGLSMESVSHNRITDFIRLMGKYSFEIYLAQVITTRYILTGDGEYMNKLIICLLLTPVISIILISVNNYLIPTLKKTVWKVS